MSAEAVAARRERRHQEADRARDLQDLRDNGILSGDEASDDEYSSGSSPASSPRKLARSPTGGRKVLRTKISRDERARDKGGVSFADRPARSKGKTLSKLALQVRSKMKSALAKHFAREAAEEEKNMLAGLSKGMIEGKRDLGPSQEEQDATNTKILMWCDEAHMEINDVVSSALDNAKELTAGDNER